ncbi:MAG TPA: ABC transporter permease [Treponema sp.]|nr:ABC transporter permease [Treponema sp.]
MGTGNKKLSDILSGGKLILLGAIIGVVILFSLLNPNYFSTANLINILLAASLTGLVAIGEAYLIIGSLCDLTPGSLVAFSGVLGATLAAKGIPFGAVILITLTVGAAVGLFNAFMINEIKLEAFIATLVSQAIFRGLAYIICSGKPVSIKNQSYIALGQARIIGIPVSVWLMIILMVIFGFILAKTKFGRSIYAVGGNKAAARLAGLNPKRINYVMFLMLGLLCALGGIVFSSRMHSGQPAANINLEFDAITAVVLGGVAFSGGVGDMAGVALGILLLQAFNTGLTMVNVPAFWQYVARGGLLLIALTSDFIRKRNRERALLEAGKKALR